ncbi:MAG: vitamin K epoxide reductase family protein [Thermoleophilia bacterium]
MKIILIIIIALALAGIADSAYALKQHYAPPDSSGCDFNATVSCTAVNQSEYSAVMGVPVAAIGIAGYLLLALLAATAMTGKAFSRQAMLLLPLISLAALTVALFLTYIELFLLKAVCPLCVLSQFLILVITILSGSALVLGRKQSA